MAIRISGDGACEKARASLIFTEKSWLKMFTLVKMCKKEVAWHGNVIKNCTGSYTVSDIAVYPQTVTAVTVDTDEEEYAQWLMRVDEDENFRSMYLQGHSHVNMGVSPSATDLRHQAETLSMMPEDGFYVFVILNKRNKIYATIYDLQDNIQYEPDDIDIRCIEDIGVLQLVRSINVLVNEDYPTQINGGKKKYELVKEL